MKNLAKPVIGFFATLMGAAVVVCLFYYAAWAKEPAPVISVDKTPIVRDAKAVSSFAPVVKKAAPSVVNIFSTQIIHMRRSRVPFDDPFFRQFFGGPSGQGDGNQQERTRQEHSLGSGIIISPDGYI